MRVGQVVQGEWLVYTISPFSQHRRLSGELNETRTFFLDLGARVPLLYRRLALDGDKLNAGNAGGERGNQL